MNTMNNKEIVDKQYSNINNLETRIGLHDKYSINKTGWINWIYSMYEINEGDSIIELGCGNGNLWNKYYTDLPNNTKLVLSDYSKNILNTAKMNLKHEENIEYLVIDIQNIPFESESFDVVIANMVLHHIMDIEKALNEVKKVLKKDGRFYCAVFGKQQIGSFVRKVLGLKEKEKDVFCLQNGENVLKEKFSIVNKHIYEDALMVTDAKDVVDYIKSLSWADELQKISDTDIINALEQYKENGFIHIPKEYGMFECRK